MLAPRNSLYSSPVAANASTALARATSNGGRPATTAGSGAANHGASCRSRVSKAPLAPASRVAKLSPSDVAMPAVAWGDVGARGDRSPVLLDQASCRAGSGRPWPPACRDWGVRPANSRRSRVRRPRRLHTCAGARGDAVTLAALVRARLGARALCPPRCVVVSRQPSRAYVRPARVMEHECLFSGAFSLDRGRVAPDATRSECKDVAGALRAAAAPPVTLLLRNGDPLVAADETKRAGVVAKVALLPLLAALGVDLPATLSASRGAWDAPKAPFVIVLGVLPTGTTLTALDVSALEAEAVVAAVTAVGLADGGGAAGRELVFAPARDFIFGAMAKGGRVRPGVRPHTPHGGDTRAATVATPATSAELMALEPSQLAWPLPWEDMAVFGWAKSLAVWHAKSAFCGSCGAPTVAVEGGVKKVCSRGAAAASGGGAPSCGESVYPRTDPVVISLIQSAGGDAILLGRQPAFPPRYYSCLAGFLEGGESIEEAVRREVREWGRGGGCACEPWCTRHRALRLRLCVRAGVRGGGCAHRVRAVLRQPGACAAAASFSPMRPTLLGPHPAFPHRSLGPSGAARSVKS
jgi:hypothetical protein